MSKFVLLLLALLWLWPLQALAQEAEPDGSSANAEETGSKGIISQLATEAQEENEAQKTAYFSQLSITPDEFKEHLQSWDNTATQVKLALQNEDTTDYQLENFRQALSVNRSEASNYVTQTQPQVTDLQNQLNALSPKPPPTVSAKDGEKQPAESEDVASDELKQRRQEVQSELAEIEGNVLSANQIVSEASGLIDQIDVRLRQNFYNSLLTRSGFPLSWQNIQLGGYAVKTVVSAFVRDVGANFKAAMGTGKVGERWPTSVFLTILAIFGTSWFFGVARKELITHEPWRKRAERLFMPVLPSVASAVILPLAVNMVYFAAEFSGLFSEDSMVFLNLFRVLGYFFAAAIWLRWALIQENHDSRARGHAFGWSLFSLAFVSGLDWTLSEFTRLADIPAQGSSTLHFFLIFIASFGAWVLSSHKNFGTLFGHTQIESLPALKEFFRVCIRFGVILAAVLSVLGYFAASYQIYRGVISTAYIIFVIIHLNRLIESWIIRWLKEFKLYDQEDADNLNDRLWPVLIQIVLWIAAIPLIALSWGVSISALQELLNRLRAGINLGDVQLSLTGIFKLILVMYIGILIVNGLKSVLDKNVLKRTRLDVGARAAIVSLAGYFGYTVAALIAMGSAGLNMSSLAYIAGALSVGIGFGLQNIVQNFISGVILLVERPVKKGDWIKVGNDEGYVQNIAVRSTQIRTFDDSTIIVPNADLITNSVTNWFHDDQSARVTVPVSVSYNADPEYVEKVLLELVEESSYKRKDPSASVVIRTLADSAVHYELRYWINDADWITRARSETFMAILKRFKKEGILIPFPQSEIRILQQDM